MTKKVAKSLSSGTKSTSRVKGTLTKNAPKLPGGSKKNDVPESIEQRIAQKAYELFERRGYQDGYAQFDWDTANSFIEIESKIRKSRRKTATKKVLESLDDVITQRAYEIFERRGYTLGSEDVDWYLAKELIDLEYKFPAK